MMKLNPASAISLCLLAAPLFLAARAANATPNAAPNSASNAAPAPMARGMIGVGTWKTQAEFKDIRVTHGAQILFQSDFSKPLAGWKILRGQWQVLDGVLRQSSGEENTGILAGDAAWGDYTLSLRARKLGGSEGFLIYFQTPNADAVTRWNIGGWNNTGHAFELPAVEPARSAGSVEAGWLDVDWFHYNYRGPGAN